VVVATDLPQPNLRALHRHLKAVDTTVVLVPDVPAPIRATLGPSNGIVRDSADSRHAWRVDKRGHLLLWQAGQPGVPARLRPATTVQRAAQLMYEFSVLYPAISGLQPSHGWMSSGHRSYDGLVIAGAHRSFPHHLFALGLGVDGLQGAFVAARLNLRHYLGAPEKGDELFGFVR
jgi:glycine/D-amino acid oxidase-like deaminating enzyme